MKDNGIVRSPILSDLKGIVHGFTNRHHSSIYGEIAATFGLKTIFTLSQIHGNKTVMVDSDYKYTNGQIEGDALITDLRSIGVGVYTADCLPILMASRNSLVCAAVHAGWRGTLAGIVANSVEVMFDKYSVNPTDITAVIGPSIGNCCYEIGEDVADLFLKQNAQYGQFIAESGGGKLNLDLKGINKHQLQSMGINDIEVLDYCTKCDNGFNSYRREGPGVKSQLSFIGLL